METTRKPTYPEYEIRVFPLAEEDGGGWAADVPELPGCFTDGDTPEEAFRNARQVIAEWLEIARDEGKPVPEPRRTRDYLFSGKFTLRIPKSLHRELAEKAEEDGVSLNQYVATLLAHNHGFRLGGERTPQSQTVFVIQTPASSGPVSSWLRGAMESSAAETSERIEPQSGFDLLRRPLWVQLFKGVCQN